MEFIAIDFYFYVHQADQRFVWNGHSIQMFAVQSEVKMGKVEFSVFMRLGTYSLTHIINDLIFLAQQIHPSSYAWLYPLRN